jgi:AbrB family looped-hinge helix DNA binding protein
MFKIKINKRGQITIPKSIRDKYGLNDGITLTLEYRDGVPMLRPDNFCRNCKKALPYGKMCADCPPIETIWIY